MRISDWSSDVCSSDLTQGPKDGAPLLPLQWGVMQSAKTMYIVESPINALSIEACGMPWTHALAVRGLTIETIDWSFLYGMQCVFCMAPDTVNERGQRPGLAAARRCYDLITARKLYRKRDVERKRVYERVYHG